MLSRALSLATVTLLVGCLAAVGVHAVENLEAGKTPAQIFSSTCNVCPKSPRGLLKSVPASSLPSFLRQHYTTSSDMASVLASYVVANGAADPRFQGKEGKEAKQKDGAKEGSKESGTKEAARVPAEQGSKQQARLPRPGEAPDVMRPDASANVAAEKGKKDKGKKGRPEEPARTDPASESRETAKREDGAKPAADAKPAELAKVEPAGAGVPATTRPDPVPAVTPAPTVTATAPAVQGPATGSSSPPPVLALDAPSAPAGEQPAALLEFPKPPAVAAAPALPPVPPAGPPAVPISQ